MAMIFPVVIYGCESWTINKAERRRIAAFELWCWRRLLRVPWTARRSNQSILKISPGCSWKVWCWGWNSNTLATWWEELTHLKRLWCWERLSAGGEGDNRGERSYLRDEMVGWQHWLNGYGFGWTPGVDDGQGGLACCSSWDHKELERLSHRTELSWTEQTRKAKIDEWDYVKLRSFCAEKEMV